jgi:hypothetical protein
MSINPGTQNIENLGNSAQTLRLIFRAPGLKIFAHDSIGKTSLFEPRPRFNQSHLPEHHANSSTFSAIPPAPTQTHNSSPLVPPPLRLFPPHANCVEQSWNNGLAKTLHFPVFPIKHCSVDLQFIFARRARRHHRDSSRLPPTTDHRSPITARPSPTSAFVV